METGYRELPFPAGELAPPDFAMSLEWTLDELLGYVRSWSATAAYTKARGTDPVVELRSRMAPRWSASSARHTVRWPLAVRVARPVPSSTRGSS